MDHTEALRQIREIVAAISHDPATSPSEALILEKVSSLLAQIPANREKQNQAMGGQNPGLQAVARALGGGAG
jgi:hypothetical protein